MLLYKVKRYVISTSRLNIVWKLKSSSPFDVFEDVIWSWFSILCCVPL